MQIADRRFLVTGGSGFVGSHVVDRLLDRGASEVVVFDRLVREANLAKAKSSGRLKGIAGDITRPIELGEAMAGVAGVFHLAAYPLSACEADMRGALEINVMGTFNVLEAARACGVARVVFSSASAVYGDTDEVMDETHPLGARTMYGACKIAGEYFLRAFQANAALEYNILRYMNVYGPRQDGGLVMAALRKLEAGQSPVIFGDGSQSFDFVHVDDLALTNVAAMESPLCGHAYNVGSGSEATVTAVVEHLIRLTGADVRPVYRYEEKVSMRRRVGSSEKAARLLGYRPTVNLVEGLQSVVDWYRKRNA